MEIPWIVTINVLKFGIFYVASRQRLWVTKSWMQVFLEQEKCDCATVRLCVTSFRLGQVSVDQLAALLDCTGIWRFRGALLQLGEIAFALLFPQALSQVRSMTRPWHWRRKRKPFSPYLTIVICYGVIQRRKINTTKEYKRDIQDNMCIRWELFVYTIY